MGDELGAMLPRKTELRLSLIAQPERPGQKTCEPTQACTFDLRPNGHGTILRPELAVRGQWGQLGGMRDMVLVHDMPCVATHTAQNSNKPGSLHVVLQSACYVLDKEAALSVLITAL